MVPKSTASWVGPLKIDSQGWFNTRIVGRCHQFHMKILKSVVLENASHKRFQQCPHQLYYIIGTSITTRISQRMAGGPSLSFFDIHTFTKCFSQAEHFLGKHLFLVSNSPPHNFFTRLH